MLRKPEERGPPDTWEGRIDAARKGSREALGQLWQACRNYLLLVANEQLPPEVKGKVGASDLVQETFVKAQQEFDRFHGETEQELLAWLRRILLNTAANVTRSFYGTAKRQVRNEVSLTAAAARGAGVTDPAAPPDAQVIAQEDDLQLEQALEQLPEVYRKVIHWRNWERRSFEAIGEQLGRSAEAARKLWARAVEQLQEAMEPSDASQ